MSLVFLIPTVISIVTSIGVVFLMYKNITLNAQLKHLNDDIADLRQENANINYDKIEYIKKNEQLSEKINYQSRLVADFERLRLESHESTKAALFTLGNDLSKQLIEIHKRENKEARELSENNIKVTAEKFNNEFEKLLGIIGSLSRDIEQSKDTVDVIKNSLLSPSGAGILAEITLENILKASGLRKGMDFSIQHTILGEDNAKLRPDALIFLPSDNIMVIDAKASKFLVQDTDKTKLAKTMNLHLKSLSSKDYSENVMKNRTTKTGNIVTLMFLPTEHAVEKIIEADSEFLNKSWRVNIFPVGPAGLMNMLSFAKFQISEQLVIQNHRKIIDEITKLIGSIASLSEHSSRLGNSIQSLVGNYDKFAASFNHNFLSKAKNVSRLGIETTDKKLAKPLQRYQIVSSKSELIEVESEEAEETLKIAEETA
jgi:DNA recombination protein RmuC